MQAEVAVDILKHCGYEIGQLNAYGWQLSFYRDKDGRPIWVEVREEELFALAQGLREHYDQPSGLGRGTSPTR